MPSKHRSLLPRLNEAFLQIWSNLNDPLSHDIASAVVSASSVYLIYIASGVSDTERRESHIIEVSKIFFIVIHL